MQLKLIPETLDLNICLKEYQIEFWICFDIKFIDKKKKCADY